MNGYALLADSYRKLAEQGKIEPASADKEIRIFDFLSTCDYDDLCSLVDSSAFNDFIRAYVRMAVDKASLDDKSRDKVLSQLGWIFDEFTASEVLAKFS